VTEFIDGELPDRIWRKIDKTGTCWLWTGGCTKRGYGKGFLDGKQVYVHRIIYEALVGEIPEGMMIDHRCHVRRCCNPAHLLAVDATGNALNRRGAQINSKSGVRGVFPHGERWRAQAKVGGRIHDGGLFDSIEAAEVAVIALRKRLGVT
jgi:hypothetical protein